MTQDGTQEVAGQRRAIADYQLMSMTVAGVAGVGALIAWLVTGMSLTGDGTGAPHSVNIWFPICAVIATAVWAVAAIVGQIAYMASWGWFGRQD
jgi:hypothetical protein